MTNTGLKVKKTRKNKLAKLALGGAVLGSSLVSLEAAKLSDVINDMTISGIAFTRVQTVHGRDAEGTRWQLRFKPTLTTGDFKGWSATVGIYFSKGSSIADSNTAASDLGGISAATIHSSADRFNISDFYITYKAKEQLGTNTVIHAGTKSPATPLNDTTAARAIGVFIENSDLSFMTVGFQWWDTWMDSDIYYSGTGLTTNGVAADNNMFLIYFNSPKSFTEKYNVAYRAYYGYINRWVDAMVFADGSYKLNLGDKGAFGSLLLTAQLGMTLITDNPHIMTANPESGLDKWYSTMGKDNYAKFRGAYNVRIDYNKDIATGSSSEEDKGDSISVNAFAGFAGSFGDGFGVILNHPGGFNLGGHLWDSYSGVNANGFGIMGAGGFKNSSIMLGYIGTKVKYKDADFGLDVAYVTATHFWYPKKAGTSGNLNAWGSTAVYGTSNAIKQGNMLDVSVNVGYKLTKNIKAMAFYAYGFGKVSLGRFRLQVNYVF